MTDTEAKALALVNEVFMERCLVPDTYTERAGNPYHEALCRAIERLEATEARHAAELREQTERFSEALLTYFPKDMRKMARFKSAFGPFILPKPDPLVELAQEAFSAMLRANSPDGLTEALRAAMQARGGKIVWGDDQ